MSITHISKATSLPLREILGGDEAKVMTPAIAANLSVLDAVVSCWFDTESCDTEISLFNRSLDILANAEIPGSGAETPVAIENQYGPADPDHFGRLVGWYMPETNAEMGILIAESFEPHLINAVDRGLIIKPRFGLWLVEAVGQMVAGSPAVTYTLKATSIDRDVLIAREKAFKQKVSASSAEKQAQEAEDLAATEALFHHIASTGSGQLSACIASQKTVGRWYRRLLENGQGCHVAIFIGRNRISIGSAYVKGSLATDVLDQLTALNNNVELQPAPFKREMRSIWWEVSGVGRSTPPDKWPSDLGSLLDEKFDELYATIQEHQSKLRQIIDGANN